MYDDLVEDPHELKNVYGNAEYSDIGQTLLAQLRTLQSDFGDEARGVNEELGMPLAHPAPILNPTETIHVLWTWS